MVGHPPLCAILDAHRNTPVYRKNMLRVLFVEIHCTLLAILRKQLKHSFIFSPLHYKVNYTSAHKGENVKRQDEKRLYIDLLFFGQFGFRSGAGLVGNAMFTAYHVAGAGAGSLFGIGGHSGGRGGGDNSGGQKGENEILSFHRDILVVKGEVFGNTAPVYRKESELSHVSNCFTS